MFDPHQTDRRRFLAPGRCGAAPSAALPLWKATAQPISTSARIRPVIRARPAVAAVGRWSQPACVGSPLARGRTEITVVYPFGAGAGASLPTGSPDAGPPRGLFEWQAGYVRSRRPPTGCRTASRLVPDRGRPPSIRGADRGHRGRRVASTTTSWSWSPLLFLDHDAIEGLLARHGWGGNGIVALYCRAGARRPPLLGGRRPRFVEDGGSRPVVARPASSHDEMRGARPLKPHLPDRRPGPPGRHPAEITRSSMRPTTTACSRTHRRRTGADAVRGPRHRDDPSRVLRRIDEPSAGVFFGQPSRRPTASRTRTTTTST